MLLKTVPPPEWGQLEPSLSTPISSQKIPEAAEPLAWLKSLRQRVQPMTFKKGRVYAESRRVALLPREGGGFGARVTGSNDESYQLEVWPNDEGEADSRCSCPSWNKYGPHCKHVVAAVLVYAARTRAALGNPAQVPEAAPASSADAEGAPRAPSTRGVASGSEAKETEAAAESKDEARGEVIALPALAKVESWLGLSAQPDFEFQYRLTPIRQTSGARHWVIDVRRLDQAGKGPVQIKRVLSAGMRLSPADERAFQSLARLEARYDARVLANDEELAELVDLLKGRRVIYRGTALLFPEEKVRPQVRLDSRSDGALARLDFVAPDGSTLELKDAVVLAGRRTYCLLGQSLYSVEPELPARLLRKWQLEPTMAFPTSQLDRVLGFFAAHLPRFGMSLSADGLEVEEGVVPKFVLTVEGTVDRVKATLGARYGNTTVPVSPSATNLGFASAGSLSESMGLSTVGAPGQTRKLYRRSEADERAAGKLLQEKGFRYESASSSFTAQNDAAIGFWAEGLKGFPEAWEIFCAQAQKVRVRAKVKPRVRVSMSGVNWFELEADFVSEDQSVDLGAVRMWLQSGRRFIPLKDGTFAEAEAEELKRAADLLEEAGALPGKTTTRLPLFHAPALDLLSELGEGAAFEAKARKAILALRSSDGVTPVRPPDGLQATLRHYQEAGISWLWFLHKNGLSGVLADDMGLGKTIQALALLQKVKNEEGARPSLVVAPTSVLANWEREAERFTPGLKTVVWHGQDRKERVEMLQGADLILTSYALVRRDGAELGKVSFRYVILDEAQNIKNADSATAQACKSLPCDFRLALTGTPLENRLSELWSLFDFLMPGFLGGADSFHDRYEHPIQVQGDVSVRERLRSRIQPFLMRRLKTEVAKDLPPKTETVTYCEMEPGQAALYREVLLESRKRVYDSIEKVGFKRSRVSILAALMRLRQVCCDPRLLKLPPGTVLPESAKLERFGDLMHDLVDEGHRALVFSQFTEMLELLKQQADAAKVPYLYLDGRTRDRIERVDAFNNPSGPPIFFISLKAGGTGLNLTAADYVIHYDPWWNPAVEDQATDRTHRIGQTKAVISYKLITRGTVEEKILALQKRKRELAAGVLGTEGVFGESLSQSDVEELFREDL